MRVWVPLTSAAKDKLDATITNIMKTSNRGNVTTECILHLKEFSLKFIIFKCFVEKLYEIEKMSKAIGFI